MKPWNKNMKCRNMKLNSGNGGRTDDESINDTKKRSNIIITLSSKNI